MTPYLKPGSYIFQGPSWLVSIFNLGQKKPLPRWPCRASQRISPGGIGICFTGEGTVQVPIDVLPQILGEGKATRFVAGKSQSNQIMHLAIGLDHVIHSIKKITVNMIVGNK